MLKAEPLQKCTLQHMACASFYLWGTHSSPSFGNFLRLIKKVRETKACSRR